MKIVKVARMPYIRARQAELLMFAINVCQCMKAGDAYEPLLSLVDVLDNTLQHYADTLAAARSKSIQDLMAKNLAREKVIYALHAIAAGLNQLAAGREHVILDAGFTLQEHTGKRYYGVIPAPVILSTRSTGKRGELRIVLRDGIPQAVRSHIIEYSLDKGLTWTVGYHNRGCMFTVKGLPHAEALWVRVISLGSGDKKSAWSEMVVVAVL